MNRKGIIFTILALLLVGALGLSVALMHTSSSGQEASTAEFDTLNSFVSDVENSFLPRILVASAYNGLNTLSIQMTDFVNLKSPSSTALADLLSGRAVGGFVWLDEEHYLWNPEDPAKGALGLLRNASIRQFSLRNLNFTNIEYVRIHQTGTWSAEVEMKIDYRVESAFGTMNWTRSGVVVRAPIGLRGLSDPFVRLCANLPGSSQISRTFEPVLPLPDELPDTLSQDAYAEYFENMTAKSLYVTKNGSAPDILDRFNGDITSSPYGVYSIIAQRWGTSAGIPDVGDPYADYCLIGSPVAPTTVSGGTPAKCQSAASPAVFRRICGNPQTGAAVTDEIAGFTPLHADWQGKIRLDTKERTRFRLLESGNRCVFDEGSRRWTNPGNTPPTDCR